LKKPSTFSPPARGYEHSTHVFAAQPGQERFPLLRAAKIIQAQFQRACPALAQTDLRPHLARCLGGGDAAHSIFSEQTLQSPSTSEAKL